MSAKPALQLTVICLLVCQSLGADPGEATYPRLKDLNNRQQEALQREQETYKGQLSTPASIRKSQQLHQDLKRQDVQQRQLQYRHRNKAITNQQRALSLPDGPVRNNADGDLRGFRREQDAQRLQFKIQRRSWPSR